ncbi:class I SAM-dependent methyltransferase [Geodermatophilus sp. SYSU D00703]
MKKEDIEAQLSDLVERHGEWTFDIPLGHGVWTRGNEGIPHTRLRRLLQVVHDLVDKPFESCRMLDLGCLDGQYSIEAALHGAHVVGIDGRPGSIAKASFAKQVLQLENVEFVCDDVRNLDPSRHGRFDAILCSGILYHLDSPDVFILMERMFDLVLQVVVIDTHVSLNPSTSIQYRGRTYHGHRVPEPHAHYMGPDVDGDHALREEFQPQLLWGSLRNDSSFHFSRPSLVNALQDVGFSSVYECFTPPHLNFGEPGIEHHDRCTFVAMKRETFTLITSPSANDLREHWPVGALAYCSS